MLTQLKAYLIGFKPDYLDVLLILLAIGYYFNLLPAVLETEYLNLQNTFLALLFKNLLPQRLDDIAKRVVK